MKKKVLILNDGSKYANWGIKACIDGLYHILDQTGTDLEVSSIDWTFMHKKYAFEPKIKGRKIFLDNNRIARRFFPLFHRIPTVADEFDYIADEWQAGRGGEGADEFIAKAKGQDLVIFNAEGSTYKNNIGALKGLFMLWFAKTRLGIKAAFMNGSVTLTRVDPVLPAMIRKVFSTIDIATVREPFSYEGILDFYPSLEQDVKMFPDSVFSLALEDQKLPETNFAGKDYFVVSRSMLPMDHRRPDGLSALGKVIKALQKRVPHVVLMAKDVEDQVLAKVAQDVGGSFVGPGYTYHQVAQVLKDAKFLMSGRYHHLIMSTQMGCPTIPITTSSHKINGLARLFPGLMTPPLDATDLEYELPTIEKYADAIMEQGQELRDGYKNRALELGTMAASQADLVRKTLTSS